ncbi:hypothetical protein COCOBI_17-2720 [Coccomyxa sp. Obi]|nr:hypothetical protein COCOBI_17-2720 [Coccomyxa sp. Obi]
MPSIDAFNKWPEAAGYLVEIGEVPSLKQVNMCPGLDEAGNILVGPGPHVKRAPKVETFFLPLPDGWQDNLTWVCPSHLNAARQRRVLAASPREEDWYCRDNDPPENEMHPTSFACLIS